MLLILIPELFYRKRYRMACKEFEGFSLFLSEICHGIQRGESISELIEASLEAMPQNAVSDNMKQIKKYFDNKAEPLFINLMDELSNYERLFFSVTKHVREYKEESYKSDNVYKSACSAIKREADHIRIKLLRVRNMLMGMFPVIFMPFLSLIGIKKWGIETFDRLSGVYNGEYGTFMIFMLFNTSFGVYIVFYLLRNMLCGMNRRYSQNLKTVCKYQWKKAEALLYRFMFTYKKLCPKKLDRYSKKLKSCACRISLFEFVSCKLCLYICGVLNGIIAAVILRKQPPGVVILCTALIFTVFVYLPDIWLLICRITRKGRISEEVLKLQGIIYVLKDMEEISIYEIIEALEETAVIYKPALKKCLLNMAADERSAFEELYAECGDERSMARLCEKIIMCDECGINKAMSEVVQEREFNYECYIEEENNAVKNISAFMGFLTFIPLGTIVIFYLIVPFVVVSIRELLNMAAAEYL